MTLVPTTRRRGGPPGGGRSQTKRADRLVRHESRRTRTRTAEAARVARGASNTLSTLARSSPAMTSLSRRARRRPAPEAEASHIRTSARSLMADPICAHRAILPLTLPCPNRRRHPRGRGRRCEKRLARDRSFRRMVVVAVPMRSAYAAAEKSEVNLVKMSFICLSTSSEMAPLATMSSSREE